MSNCLLKPNEIQQWRPSRLADFVGCKKAKAVFLNHLRNKGDGPNVLLTGETGTAKTSLVEAYVRTRNCPNVVDPLLGPCGKCQDCRVFDFEYGSYELFGRYQEGDGITHFHHVSCFGLDEQKINQLVIDVNGSGNDRSIIFLDEVQALVKGNRDLLLTKPLKELKHSIWIGAGISADELSPMFVRLFAKRCSTSLHSDKELALFLLERCEEWEINYDEPETLALLARRSRGITAECINVLADAASQEGRRLDKDLVLDHPFITGVTR